ncbi:MAG: hypothetical protein OIF56_14965 [Cohaesibacter sp.]|nr:hypothetical protein [Cohaesibacter sp.]
MLGMGKKYKPDVYYNVRLNRAVTVGAFTYFPREGLRMAGKILNKILGQKDGSAISSAKQAK